MYALPGLPEKEDWRGRMRADPSKIGLPGQLVAEAEDTYGGGNIRIRLDKPVTLRYLALAWQGADLADFKAYEIAVSGPGQVRHSQQPSASLAFAEALAGNAEEAADEPVMMLTQVMYQPPPTDAGTFTGFGAGGYSAGIAGGFGSSGGGSGTHWANSGDEPSDDEDLELDWPEIGVDWPVVDLDWCFSPSAL